MAYPLPRARGLFNVIDQNDIPLFCPDGREESEVVTQLPSGVWGCEISQSRGQCNVVFRVEDM